jgi:hypothetical protein
MGIVYLATSTTNRAPLPGVESTLRRAPIASARSRMPIKPSPPSSRGRTDEAVEYWQKALQGEDDEGELDKARVERKIRDAQTGLRAQQTP